MWIYYFRSDSGKEYLNWSDKEMDVGEAIVFFGWESWEEWLDDGYTPDEIPYQSFLKREFNGHINRYGR